MGHSGDAYTRIMINATNIHRVATSAAGALAMVMLLVGCGQESSQGDTPNPAASTTSTPTMKDGDGKNPCLSEGNRVTPPDSSPDVADYVGLSEREAQTKAKDQQQTIRIAGRDGECFALTMDYRPDRVNLYLEDDRVAAATLG